MLIDIPDHMLARLKEHIDGADYCYLCDQHPGPDDRGHAADCPLRAPGAASDEEE